MPAKYSRKTYVENSYYHIYNRGVEKRVIFLDEQDYGVFISYLKDYLLPKADKELTAKLSDSNIDAAERRKILQLLALNNFSQEITLLAYCLMPNHFHLLIKQTTLGSIDKFMNSLGTRYTMYFNRKYKRVGSLYQGVYKAVLVSNDSQFLHLSRYIHKQALDLVNQPCSFPEYGGFRKTAWVNPEEVLAYFSKTIPSLSYRNFVYDSDNQDALSEILTLEDGFS